MDFWSGIAEWFTKPPEPLVLGAELWCPYGSEHSFLILQRDEINIDSLPQANVCDCVKSVNIDHFGECYGGQLCKDKMILAGRWENPEPQTEIVNGKEIITTESVLLCRAGGMEIQAANSGQKFGKKLAEQINLKLAMDVKYPGLYDLLTDPYGSLYLNEGMYETALAFLADRITDKGDIFLPAVFDGNDLENEMVRLALGRLMPRCDISTYDRFINGLEDTGLLTGMNEEEGWDVHYLNDEMMEMLRKDCETTNERVQTDPTIRWQEENRVFTSSMSDAMTQLSKAVVMYLASQSQPAEKTGENPLKKLKEKVEDQFKKGKKTDSDIINDIIKSVENGDTALTNNIQKGNYGEMKMDSYFESQGYERISLDRVTDLNSPTHQGIDGVYYKADGHPPYVIGEAKYGSSKLGYTRDGMQMSDTWIKGSDRLVNSVGKDAADEIMLKGYEKQLVNVGTDGTIGITILN